MNAVLRKRGRTIRSSRRNAGFSLTARLITFLAAVLVIVAFADMQIRPAVEAMIAYQARLRAFGIVNSAMLEELESGAAGYDKIIHIARMEDGSIASIQTDIVAVNLLKTRLAGAVAGELREAGKQPIRVPAGTLMGSQLIAGRGPEIEVRVIPMGDISSELYNEFLSAGINQTLHRVMLKTKVGLLAVMPGYNVETETETSFCVAETVIVGAIPEGYTVVAGDDSSDIGKINDYNAYDRR